MGRYDHLKPKPKKKVSPIKRVRQIGLILFLAMVVVGIVVRIIIHFKH